MIHGNLEGKLFIKWKILAKLRTDDFCTSEVDFMWQVKNWSENSAKPHEYELFDILHITSLENSEQAWPMNELPDGIFSDAGQ